MSLGCVAEVKKTESLLLAPTGFHLHLSMPLRQYSSASPPDLLPKYYVLCKESQYYCNHIAAARIAASSDMIILLLPPDSLTELGFTSGANQGVCNSGFRQSTIYFWVLNTFFSISVASLL